MTPTLRFTNGLFYFYASMDGIWHPISELDLCDLFNSLMLHLTEYRRDHEWKQLKEKRNREKLLDGPERPSLPPGPTI